MVVLILPTCRLCGIKSKCKELRLAQLSGQTPCPSSPLPFPSLSQHRPENWLTILRLPKRLSPPPEGGRGRGWRIERAEHVSEWRRESEVSLEDSPSYPDLSELSFARPDPHPPLMSHRRARGRRKTRHKATRIHVLHFHCGGGGGVLFLSSPPPNKGQDRERDRERESRRASS